MKVSINSSGIQEDLIEFNEMGGSIFILPGNKIIKSSYSNFLAKLKTDIVFPPKLITPLYLINFGKIF